MPFNSTMSEKAQTIHTNVFIPIMQAIITGLLFALVAVSTWAAWQNVTGWRLFWLALFGSAFLAWLVILGRLFVWGDALHGIQPKPESVTAFQTETSMLHISIDWDNGRQGVFDDIQITDDQFIQWACEVAQGKSLGENHHTGSAGIFSKGQYHQMIDRLSFMGFVRQKSKAITSGYVLTGKGRAVCDELLKRYGSAPNIPPTDQVYLPG